MVAPPALGQRGGVSAPELAGAIDDLRADVRRLVSGGDLIDGLYFGWADRPYGRLTVACAVKALAALEYEQRLQSLGNGAMDERQLADVLAWVGPAMGRAGADEPHGGSSARRLGFDPHWWASARTEVRGSGSLTAPESSARLYGFSDRATVTHHDTWSGDLDVLACLGFRVVGRPIDVAAVSDDWALLAARATALGVTLVAESDKGADGGLPGQPSVVSHTLADLMGGVVVTEEGAAWRLIAVADQAGGESWPESLARRALYRGATGAAGAIVTGWRPPRMAYDHEHRAAQTSLAMWVHAIDGQRLALIGGWRDLRDGSGSPYPSLIADPEVLEAVARAGLDILYHRDALVAFDSPRPVMVVGEPECVRGDDSNRWAEGYATLFAGLVGAGIRFDVVPEARLAEAGRRGHRYAAVLLHEADGAPDVEAGSEMTALFRDRLIRWGSAPEKLASAVGRVRGLLPDAAADRLVVTGPNGGGVGELLVFIGTGRTVALANPTREPRTVWLTTANGDQTPALRDLIGGEVLTRPDQGVAVGAWQVRLLVPAGR